MNLVHRAFGIFNILLAVFFAAQIVWSRIQETSDPGSFVFWTILAVASLVSGIGYFITVRWIVALGTVPVILLCLFFALTSLVGGWIWGPRGTDTVNLLIMGGFGLALLQLVGLGTAFLSMGRRPPDQPPPDMSP